MKTIRRGVFETNSSSTHSISICSKADYDAWQNGKMYWDSNKQKMVTREEAMSKIEDLSINMNNDDAIDNYLASNEELLTADKYHQSELEEFAHRHTAGGEEIVAFGQYGYDG